jgi:hypothetical protein
MQFCSRQVLKSVEIRRDDIPAINCPSRLHWQIHAVVEEMKSGLWGRLEEYLLHKCGVQVGLWKRRN